MLDDFKFKNATPDGFKSGLVMCGFFSHTFIANQERLDLPSDNDNHDKKPKYAFAVAYPFENKKIQVRETEYMKFSCSEDDYIFLNSCTALSGQAVYVGCEPASWATGTENHGVWYKFISGTLIRFDGKPLQDALSGKKITS